MQDLLLKFLGKKWADVQFSPVPKGQQGDLALSFFELSKKTKKSPLELAKEVQEILVGAEHCSALIEKTHIVGPYLNLFFKNDVFFEEVLKTPLSTNTLKKKNIVLEFSGPNTNKPLHLGHMRNHALGISVSNVLEAAGAKVHRVNIINDRGVHICKSMLAYQKWGKGETPESTGEKSDHFVGRYYVKFEQESKNDPSLKDEIQVMLVKWEEGDKTVRDLWIKMNGWALAGHAKTYTRQKISFEKIYSESETYHLGKKIAEEGLKKKVFKKREDGAIVIDLTQEKLDEKVILRGDGTSIYLTQDLAVATMRDKDFSHPDEMIYVVADEQNYHFQVLFLCLEKLGILTRDKLCHLGYGLVNLPHGRMKSREGTVVDADNLMDELSGLALQEIKKRNPEIPEKEAKVTAEKIMDAAWKFYLLHTSPKKTMLFDPEKSITFEGGTGPYLQYAGVRIKSILKKCLPREIIPPKAGSPRSGISRGKGFLGNPEKPLGVKILEFPHVIDRAAETKNPTYLATYLLELAQEWSSFYGANSVLSADSEGLIQARLLLAKKVLDVLEEGLRILGIEIPEMM